MANNTYIGGEIKLIGGLSDLFAIDSGIIRYIGADKEEISVKEMINKLSEGISGKADVKHNHEISDIDELPGTIDNLNKEITDLSEEIGEKADVKHNHEISDINELSDNINNLINQITSLSDRITALEKYHEIVPVSGITIDPTSTTLEGNNDTITLTANVSPSNATNKFVKWSSTNTDIATVNETTGKVTPKGVGTTTIKATSTDGSEISGSCEVTVNEGSITDVSLVSDDNNPQFSSDGGIINLTANVKHDVLGSLTYDWYIDDVKVKTTNTHSADLDVPKNDSEIEYKIVKYKVKVALASNSDTAIISEELLVTVKPKSSVETKYYWYLGNGDEIVKNDPATADIDWSKAQQITSFESLGYSTLGTEITMNKTGENNVFILCPKSWSSKWQFWNENNTIDLTTGFSELSELLGISSFVKDGVEYDLWVLEMYAGNIAYMRSK